MLEKGTIVDFRLQGEGSEGTKGPRVGVVDRPEGKKHWVVIDATGQSHTVHLRQINYVVEGQSCRPNDLQAFLNTVEAHLDPTHLELAWELLVEECESTNPAELAMLLFSSQDPPICYAAYRLLAVDKLYFKLKGDRYEPRPVNQVADLQQQIQRQLERQEAQQVFHDKLQRGLAGEAIEWTTGDRAQLIPLEQYALYGDESNARAAALELLQAMNGGRSADDAFQALVALGIWTPHENLALRRSQHPIEFPANVLSMLNQHLAIPPTDPDSHRHDLTHLKVYTIDDEGTEEIDDGLSLEFLANGQERLWIHIADPSRWVEPGDPIDLEAQRRSTTVYLPTGRIPMFPEKLSAGPMSLRQGLECCALSFGIVLAANGAIADYEICVSLIKPTYRLTYDDVDEMLELGLETEAELLAIAAWAKQRQVWREEQGAISIQLPESSIKVQDDQIQIQVLQQDSPSRVLVAEMMILAGQVAAAYGEYHGLPLPFRHQSQPDLPSEEELLLLPPGPVRGCALRRCMPRSEVGTTPARHASLGLDSYCQVTSPIRRYTDLLAHFQIKAHLRGTDLPFDEACLNRLLASITTVSYEATQLERQTNRYWSLEYLRRQRGQVWQAQVLRWLREYQNLGLVLLEDLGLELPMRFQRTVHLGDYLEVIVNEVEPRLDRIYLAEYAASTAS